MASISKQRNLKLYYTLHTWTGLISANLLFILCFSGAIALFKNELQAWEKTPQRIPHIEMQGIVDVLVSIVITEIEFDPKSSLFIKLPNRDHPALEVRFQEKGTGSFKAVSIDPVSLKIIKDQGNNVAYLMRMMHTDLMLPKPWGRYLVGLMGIVMLFSLMTGILMHRKFFIDIFNLRIRRSTRLLWADTHKLLGVWGTPFLIMIAYTGALLGLKNLLLPVVAMGAFSGDVNAASVQILGEKATYSDVAAKMVYLDNLIEKAHKAIPNATPDYLLLNAWGDANAQAEIHMKQSSALTSGVMVKFSGVSGEILKKVDLLESSTPFYRAFMAAKPLHYALYGGLMVKLLYYLLGLGSSVLVITGILIWQARRTRKAKDTLDKNYMSHFTVGVCAGLVFATAVSFWANKLLPLTSINGGDYFFWVTNVFFLSWGLCLVWSLWRFNSRQSIVQLLGIAAILTISLPVLNGLITGDWLFSTLIKHQWHVAGADLVMLLTGLVLLRIVYRLKASDLAHK